MTYEPPKETIVTLIRCIRLIDDAIAKEDIKGVLWLPAMTHEDKCQTIISARRQLKRLARETKAASIATSSRINRIVELLEEIAYETSQEKGAYP